MGLYGSAQVNAIYTYLLTNIMYASVVAVQKAKFALEMNVLISVQIRASHIMIATQNNVLNHVVTRNTLVSTIMVD